MRSFEIRHNNIILGIPFFQACEDEFYPHIDIGGDGQFKPASIIGVHRPSLEKFDQGEVDIDNSSGAFLLRGDESRLWKVSLGLNPNGSKPHDRYMVFPADNFFDDRVFVKWQIDSESDAFLSLCNYPHEQMFVIVKGRTHGYDAYKPLYFIETLFMMIPDQNISAFYKEDREYRKVTLTYSKEKSLSIDYEVVKTRPKHIDPDKFIEKAI